MNLLSLNNRKILITGASSGIGRATAILLSELGAQLVITGRDEKRLKETIRMLKNPELHKYYSLEITDFEAYKDFFDKVVADGKKLDGLVHAAGIAKVVPLRMMNCDTVREIMDTNFTSFMMLMSMYSKKKYASGGSVVAISAANAHYPQKCMSIYAASKSAIEAAVSTMAIELSSQSIRINCVVPGAIDTGMMKDLDEQFRNYITEKQLLGVGQPEDVANLIAFLLSDASSFITGRAMYVDGGMLS